MSFLVDQIQRIDAQLDRLHLQAQAHELNLITLHTSSSSPPSPSSPSSSQLQQSTSRIASLQALIKALSIDPTASRPLLSARSLEWYIKEASLCSATRTDPEQTVSTITTSETSASSKSSYEQDLEWLLVSKAVAQTYGLALDCLLNQNVSIASDLSYWDEVLSRWRYTVLYGIQTSPLRLWDMCSAVWDDARRRASDFDASQASILSSSGSFLGQESVAARWGQFYRLVRQVVHERGAVLNLQSSVVSPVSRLRAEIRFKQAGLRQARLRGANALGILLGEGLLNEVVHGDGLATLDDKAGDDNDEVAGRRNNRKHSIMARNVALMDAVLSHVNHAEPESDGFNKLIERITNKDELHDNKRTNLHPATVADLLLNLLTTGLLASSHSRSPSTLVHTLNGKPSFWTRHWPALTVAIFSSTTLLRILFARQADLLTWLQDLATTSHDFWTNWVVEPARKLLATIRHDAGSEISLMSRRSLEGDRASLERMVVQFASDSSNNNRQGPAPLPNEDGAQLLAAVREGDLTPVLRAYERELASPLLPALLRGTLVRALLIQVQKTKVDVELAMGGIDDLLKSQELVFGLVGLTPGLLVVLLLGRWLLGSALFMPAWRVRVERERGEGGVVRSLRNVHRILAAAAAAALPSSSSSSTSTPSSSSAQLSYRDHGLLLCEVSVLAARARAVMPAAVYREFGEDLAELADVRTGLGRQREFVDRLRWAYSRWF